jgi:hypothetical protein
MSHDPDPIGPARAHEPLIAVRRLRATLDRDREQAFGRMLTARPAWHHGLPSRRELRRALLRQAALNVAVMAAVCAGWLASAVWRAWH